MKISKIVNYINSVFPENTQYDFDNSGENIIINDNEVSRILVTLDINMDAINYAIKNNVNLIISHHPIIFHSIKNLNDNILSKKISKILKNDISCYSIHTNFDVNIKSGMSKIIINKIFSNKDVFYSKLLENFVIDKKKYGIGNVVVLNKKKNINDLVTDVISKLDLPKKFIRLFTNNTNQYISKLILIPGSGSGMMDMILKEKCDLVITSELKHDQIVDLLDNNISYFDGTHYGIEKHFIDFMTKFLNKKNKNIAIPYYNNHI